MVGNERQGPRAGLAAALVLASVIVAGSCGGETLESRPESFGGTSGLGGTAGGGGSTSTGGSSRGGDDAGGRNTGGRNTGGRNTGGRSTGGSSNAGGADAGAAGAGGEPGEPGSGGEGGRIDPPDCSEGRVVDSARVNSESELEALAGVVEVRGPLSLSIPGPFRALACLARVGGDLTFGEPSGLKNFLGLENLKEVGGDLEIYHAFEVETLEGLEGLERVGGRVRLYYTPSLSSLRGLRSLTSVGSDFEIYSNGIEDLHGLESLESVGGLIAIEGTAIRTLEGFSALARMSGGIYVRGNFQLTDLGPLVGVDRITGSLSLEWNGLLDYSGLRDLVAVDGYLFLAEGAARDLGGLESLRTVGQGLWLGSELESLRGIEGLTSVGGDLVLAYVALSNPSELPSTLSIGGSLRIEFPRRLTSLEGVANPRVFGGLSIAGTELENLEGLSGGNFPGGVTVQDNGRLTSLRGIEGVSLAGGLTLSNNDALTDLSALSGQTTLEHLVITSNALLSSLAGLESVESITNSLSIVPICRTEYEDWDEEMENPIRRCYGNDALMSLRALANLRSVGGNFEVRENRALASCEAEWLRDSVGVANIGGTVSVSGNTGTATCAP